MLFRSLSTNKICTTLFWSNTLSFFLNGQTELVKECFNSQMFCLVSQTKSFSMSKCIDPWVDEVACSIKNLVSSLNRLFNVLIKICLYLSFSMTLSFLQFHTLLLPTSNIFRFQCQHSLSRWKSQYSHKTTQFSSYLLEHYAAKRVGK